MNRLAVPSLVVLALSCAHEKPAPVAPAPAPAPALAPAAPAHKAFADLTAVDAAPLRTKITPEEVAAGCGQAEKDTDAKLAALVSVPDAKRTWADAFGGYEQATTDYADAIARLTFLKEIHTDAKVRAASAACEERAGKYVVRLGARKDLYLAMKGFQANEGAKVDLDAVDKRLVEVTMLDFKKNGLELSDADRAKLVELRSRIAELQSQFDTHLAENTDSFEATKDELLGMPESYVARLKKTADGKRYVVTTKYPDYYPLAENAKSEAVRKRAYIAFNAREAKSNLPLLTEAIALRDQAAKLLGFPTHADFVTQDRMAQNAKTVADFLARVRAELVPARDALDAKMLAMKIAETKDKKARLEDWDWRYYVNELKKRDYQLDDEAVREYFPADKALAGMFQVYATLFGVKFEEAPADPWAEGVKLYAIRDADTGRLVAKFYVDLFPREGKYGHAASFNIGVSRATPSGYQIPLSALVVNFNPPANGKVAKLAHDEVRTLFHEFGHIMHMSLTTARYNSLGGSNVAWDFVEAPSQMLENFVFRPEVLPLISQDPKDPSKSLPAELGKKLDAARSFDAGIKYTRQVFLASIDQYLHTHGDKVDADAAEHKLREEIIGYPALPEEHFLAGFGHLMGGYDGGYYGYLWSEVFADDIFSRFEKDGVLNPATGKVYRETILARGREDMPMALLTRFLGREPNEEAFLRLTGIKGAPAAK